MFGHPVNVSDPVEQSRKRREKHGKAARSNVSMSNWKLEDVF